jgi:cytochrome c oxidase assembly protein subunit 11
MTTTTADASRLQKVANRRLAWRLFAVVAASLAFAYTQPSLYKAFCEWTGLYDIDRADKADVSLIAARPVRIEFDANTHDSGLRFRPEISTIQVDTGQIVNVTYRVENMRDTPVIGQAIPSYGPKYASEYVKKLDCFCFKQQTFAPHEVRELPVVFFMDTALPEDVSTVTLSYTFFEVPAGKV